MRLYRWQSTLSVAAALRQIRPGTLPSTAYAGLRASGVLRPDAHQGTVLPLLDDLHGRIAAAADRRLSPAAAPSSSSSSSSRGLWGAVFSSAPAPPPRLPHAASPGGLYLWGGTGCGKTLLMDVFLACAPAAARARRVHFHEFMQKVNAKMHAARGRGGDPLAAVAAELIAEGWMLCFDEVQVTDVGDALILRRLFEGLYEGGLVMLATSNRAPGDLYHGGLQRELFLPFISLLSARCTVHNVSSPTDHRLRVAPSAGGSAGSAAAAHSPWICPQDGLPEGERRAAAAFVARAFEAAWARAAGGALAGEVAMDVPVEGHERTLRIPRALPRQRAARFTFQQLCGSPLYAGDYAALARHFSSVYLEGVPVLGMGERNELRRFITLIDILYDGKVRLTASAAASPQRTFQTGEEGAAPSAAHKVKFDEVFAWDRAVSRLVEMQGEEYGA